MLAMMQEYYSIEAVPDHSTLCRKIQSDRFAVVLDRLFQHILSDLPTRKVVASTDATGYSGSCLSFCGHWYPWCWLIELSRIGPGPCSSTSWNGSESSSWPLKYQRRDYALAL
jgi:hypothetical protein